MTPQEFEKIRDAQLTIIEMAEKTIQDSLEITEKCPLPENLRPATAKDIVKGAVIWYKHGGDGHFWQIVEEVLHPNDRFKAYSAIDGCRYGLGDAWLEVKK